MNFDDNWDRKFDKQFDKATKLFGFFWVLATLASLATTGVVIWAIVVLVNHFAK